MTDAPDDLDAWLEDGKLVEAQVPVVLSGDLHQRYVEVLTEIADLAGDETLTLEDDRLTSARERAEDLRSQIEKHTRTITVRAMDPAGYYRLIVEHPPRDGDEVDKAHGVNFDTFTPALVEASTDLSKTQVAKLRRKVSHRQWSDLWQTARDLSSAEVSVPKSLPAFGKTPNSGGGPRQRKGSGSRPSGSKAGSRRRSTSTTTPGD
jgi:hypothetical protein